MAVSREETTKPLESTGLNPITAATAFVRICGEIEARIVASVIARDGLEAASQRIYNGNPQRQLFKLIDQFYAGTQTGKRRQLVEGFIQHGFYEYDSSYSGWPQELGFDIANGEAGAFTPAGAQAIERDDLLFWLTLPREDEDYFLFARQAEEYESLFGKPYYELDKADTETVRHAAARAPSFLDEVRQKLAKLTTTDREKIVLREAQILEALQSL